MKQYNIPLSEADIELIISSVKAHAETLMDHIGETREKLRDEAAKKFMDQFQIRERSIEELLQPSVQKPAIKENAKPTAVYAPHGLKKDGTASKRRGRPSTKAKKVSA